MLSASGKDFVPRGPRDCPRIGPEGNLESPPTDALTFFIWSLPELLCLEANWSGRLFCGKWGLADWALQKCPSFPGPNLPGPNLPGPDFPGLNLPKKSPLGQVCLDPSSKWRGFRFRYWFLSWCLPYSFGILFLNLSLSLSLSSHCLLFWQITKCSPSRSICQWDIQYVCFILAKHSPNSCLSLEN